jgi:hypothetical protein
MIMVETCKPDEIVPAALRKYLRWDHRHDRMAAGSRRGRPG